MQRIYVCDGTIDGIFTAVYEAWASGYGHKNIRLMEQEQLGTMELFCEYIDVVTDVKKAEKVARTIPRRISEYGYYLVCHGCLSKMPGRSDAVYRFLLFGFSQGEKVTEQMAHPYVQPIYNMYRNVNNEVLHYRGFLRFRELKNGLLAARIRPENAILTLLAPHFEDRFQGENWIIYDEGRQAAAIHKAHTPWVMIEGEGLQKEKLFEYSEGEMEWQRIWEGFVDTIGIDERKNPKLQRQMLPYRYREFMSEFIPTADTDKIKKITKSEQENHPLPVSYKR